MEHGLFQLLRRLQIYAHTELYQVLIELAVIWIIVFFVVRFLRGTRGARVIKGVAIILILATLTIQVLGRENAFERLNFLYNHFMGFVALMLVVVFQPELRRALMRLGEAKLFRPGGLRKSQIIEEIMGAIEYLSKNKIGALIAIEREAGLKGMVDIGTHIDAKISKEILNTIFWPGSALHDMGVVVRGDRIIAAGVQFPLADPGTLPQELGSRHRAAVGLSQETDAFILIVSEETGTISIAQRGQLTRNITLDSLRERLTEELGKIDTTIDDTNSLQTDSIVDNPGNMKIQSKANSNKY